MLRGGSLYYSPQIARCAYRYKYTPGKYDDAGFRLVMLEGGQTATKVIPEEPPPLPEPPPQLTIPFTAAQAQAAQAAWAKSLGKMVVETNTLGMEFVLIPPGTFQMGSPTSEVGRGQEEDQVKVTLTEPIWLWRTEVAQGQWKQVMGTTPWKGKPYFKAGDDYAANYVSWNDAQEFVRKLSQRDSETYRLPTEAEWEWSCRAGTASRWSFGESEADATRYEWYGSTLKTGQHPHEGGLKFENPFGIYDMHGNVMEWCDDVYVAKLPGGTNPNVIIGGNLRILRGGAWDYGSRLMRSANRSTAMPEFRNYNMGFRVSRVR